MKKILITRPNYDTGMEYLSAWSKQIIDEAEERGWVVSKADGQNAVKKEVQSKLEKTKPNLAVFNGHGTVNEIYGQTSEAILNSDSAHLLKNNITFARSCDCLNGLGEASVNAGCKAFIGYSENFWFPKLNEYNLKPLQDPVAKPVLEISNLIPLKLIKDSTVEEAIESSHLLANKLILKLVVSAELNDRAILRAIIQNDDCLGFKGDEKARIEN